MDWLHSIRQHKKAVALAAAPPPADLPARVFLSTQKKKGGHSHPPFHHQRDQRTSARSVSSQ